MDFIRAIDLYIYITITLYLNLHLFIMYNNLCIFDA